MPTVVGGLCAVCILIAFVVGILYNNEDSNCDNTVDTIACKLVKSNFPDMSGKLHLKLFINGVSNMEHLNDGAKQEGLTAADATIYEGIRDTLAQARAKVYSAINSAMVEAYWDIGQQIENAVGDRAEYGKGLLRYLAAQLTSEFGKGFDESSLRRMRQFYKTFPNRATLWHELSWSHYRLLMKIEDESRREFYARECVEAAWSVRQLKRQINSFFYERLLATQKSGRERVKNEIQTLEPKTEPDYILKDPYILEFLDLKEKRDY